MILKSVVCRVEDELGEHLHNVDPATFMDLLSAAVEGASEVDELAALEAELNAGKAAAAAIATDVAKLATELPKTVNGETVLPYAAFDPLIGAKTRGELFVAVNALLSQFGVRIAEPGQA
jgi:hypothetical protein